MLYGISQVFAGMPSEPNMGKSVCRSHHSEAVAAPAKAAYINEYFKYEYDAYEGDVLDVGSVLNALFHIGIYLMKLRASFVCTY